MRVTAKVTPAIAAANRLRSGAGLRVMLALRKRTQAAGIRLCLCRLQPAVQQVFEISGFTGIFALFPTLEEALA